MKKYKLIKQDSGLFRIKALRDFGRVWKGDIGGLVSSEVNLRHDGNCWIYENASVIESAIVCDNARVLRNALVKGLAQISDNATIDFNAKVSCNAIVSDNSYVSENATVKGRSHIKGNAYIHGNAFITDDSCIYGNAQIYGEAEIEDGATVRGFARVSGHAKVGNSQNIAYGHTTVDLTDRENLKQLLSASCDLAAIGNKVIAYKQVIPVTKKLFRSEFDKNFYYEIGKISKAPNATISNDICGDGIHASSLNYWTLNAKPETCAYIALEINLKDIICVSGGKIRCTKAKTIARVL